MNYRKIDKQCRLCKKPAWEVTIIHNTEHNNLHKGYCTSCQDTVFIFWDLPLLVFVSAIFALIAYGILLLLGEVLEFLQPLISYNLNEIGL